MSMRCRMVPDAAKMLYVYQNAETHLKLPQTLMMHALALHQLCMRASACISKPANVPLLCRQLKSMKQLRRRLIW